MDFQLPVFSLLLFGSAGLMMVSAYIGWQHQEIAGSGAFVAFALMVALWAGTYAMQLVFTTVRAQLFWDNVQYFGGLLTPVSFFIFAIYYVGREHQLTPVRVAVCAAVPVLTATTVWVPQLQWLVRRDATMTTAGSYAVLDITYGPLFSVAVVYSYLLVLAGLGLLVMTTLQTRQLYRRQTGLITLAAVVPITGSVVSYVLDLTVIDYTPVGLTVFGVIFTTALTRYQLLDVYPVPRDRILQHIDNGIVATDGNGRIVDINPAAKRLLGVDGVVGHELATVDSAHTDEIVSMAAGTSTEIVTESDETRYFRCDKSTLQTSGGVRANSLYIFTDITDRQQRQAELEAKNERLDSFAEVLSHDLRNPLSVAAGSAELAEADPEGDHFTRIHDAHERMSEIIEDMLALARSGQSVADTEPVDIGSVATQAWSLVTTHDATLTVADTPTVAADGQRLQQLFENLFRNSVEHGGQSVSVRVGPIESGFYVEDDGPGIPAEKRGTVCNAGVSGDTDGTGVGLAIVTAVIEGHGWSITVTESETGGARFEIHT